MRSLLLVLLASPAGAAELVDNGDFAGDLAGWTLEVDPSASATVDTSSGAACIDITSGGTEWWHVGLSTVVSVAQGTQYTLGFGTNGSVASSLHVKLGARLAPYTAYYEDDVTVPASAAEATRSFTSGTSDADAGLVFFFGGQGAEVVCLDDVSLQSAGSAQIAINQVRYPRYDRKLATLAAAAGSPLHWDLVRAGDVVLSGDSLVVGQDSHSGQHLHEIDFTSYETAADDLVLSIYGEESLPLSVGASRYGELGRDAASYFYHNRSGVPIVMPYAGETRFTRPAGHPDTAVPCAPDAGCDYELDVHGGWYDAGDHGKYVVNGGIAVWTLQNLYERSLYVDGAAAFTDGQLSIPEGSNGVPDLLDEARFEMEFLLRMQVPDDEPHAGMAHHKIHDTAWTSLPMAPDEDSTARALRPVSTAATLNLAATAAQAARLWEPYDAPFAAACLDAAERAYAAAEDEPALYIPASDNQGGGAYDDNHVADEFYWAAAELYVTTGEPAYADALTESSAFATVGAIDWGHVAGLGTLTLALVPNALSDDQLDEVRGAVISAAESNLALAGGYRVPHGLPYEWGSNSVVLDNLLVIATAHYFEPRASFRAAVAAGLDYLLGRNPLSTSYVTGWGAVSPAHPHHRFWANEPPDYPAPPPGALVGGPNAQYAGTGDAAASAALAGCVQQTCWADVRAGFSINEVAINWNAPLVWAAFWMDEQAAVRPPAGDPDYGDDTSQDDDDSGDDHSHPSEPAGCGCQGGEAGWLWVLLAWLGRRLASRR